MKYTHHLSSGKIDSLKLKKRAIMAPMSSASAWGETFHGSGNGAHRHYETDRQGDFL